MTKQEKDLYNQKYYDRNQPELLARANSRYSKKKKYNSNVIPLFKSKSKNKKTGKDLLKRKKRMDFGTIYLQILVVAMTIFLVNEAAHFYSTEDGIQLSGYFKAILLEGAVFAFTTLKARSNLTGVLYRIMILSIYAYSTYAISGSVLQGATLQSKQVLNQEKIVAELEAEISKKALLRDSFFQANRTTLASKLDQVINTLNQKLEQSRDFLAKSPSVSGIWNTLVTLILFRVFIMISNLFCLKELSRRFLKNSRTL